MTFSLPDDIQTLVARGALFVINDSGGKDSQAMKALLKRHIPSRQLLIVHAVLDGEEWEGTTAHVHRYAGTTPVIIARSVKTFAEMVERRRMFPSPQQRQCTSDLKRDPIDREIRRHLAKHPEFGGLIVNCMGMRSQESPARAKLIPFKSNTRNSKAGRAWFDWLPIHDFTTAQVFQTIEDHGQVPHWAYGAGMTRLSCMFCIMSSQGDLRTAALHNPAAYRERVQLERKIGHTINMEGRPLDHVVGIPVDLDPAN